MLSSSFNQFGWNPCKPTVLFLGMFSYCFSNACHDIIDSLCDVMTEFHIKPKSNFRNFGNGYEVKAVNFGVN